MAGAAALMLAGCSSEVGRFAADGKTDLTPTATIPYAPPQRTPLMSGGPVNGQGPEAASTVRRLSPIQSTPLAPASSKAISAATTRTSAVPRPSYSAPATPSPQAAVRQTTQAPAATAAISRPATTGNWSTQGGTPIVVAQGETASLLSNRYGVPNDALLRANGLTTASQVQPGSRLVIPVYNANARTATTEPAQATRAAAAPTPASAPMSVKPVKQAAVSKPVKTERLVVATDADSKPQTVKQSVAAAKPAAPPKSAPPSVAAAKPAPQKVAEKPAPKEKLNFVKGAEPASKVAATNPAKVAEVKPAQSARVEKPARQQIAAAKPTPAQAVDHETTTGSVDPNAGKVVDAGDKPEFRWPARGRVIQGFKPGANDGINIALPEGTSVKAAEGGTVAYAGSDLKGYGNMVLIRHPNGYVSAYANNGSVAVKKGDKISRGQTIATSGQTGNVSSPQLHFELRKGSTPVDPTGYLAGL